jgi:hypothetical protein
MNILDQLAGSTLLPDELCNICSDRTETRTNNTNSMTHNQRTKPMTQKQAVSVAPEKTEDASELATVVVTIQQQVPMEATFKVTVPRKDAENHDVLLRACDEEEQEQDAFGYYEPQAGEWHYDGELQYADIDVLGAEVIYSEITGVVEPDEDEDGD